MRGKAVLRSYTTCCWAEVMAKKMYTQHKCIADESSTLLVTINTA